MIGFRLRAMLWFASGACALLALSGCVRHGCVRNSDCSSKFECVDGRCAPKASGDAAVASAGSGEGGSQGSGGSGGAGGTHAGEGGGAGKKAAGLDAGQMRDGGAPRDASEDAADGRP